MTTIQTAAGLLEIEALLMQARSQALQRNQRRFPDILMEAHAKLGALVSALFADGGAVATELFLATEDEPPSADAVDPHAASTGTPTPREAQ
jgi:hypothetical protein